MSKWQRIKQNKRSITTQCQRFLSGFNARPVKILTDTELPLCAQLYPTKGSV